MTTVGNEIETIIIEPAESPVPSEPSTPQGPPPGRDPVRVDG
jgi:hypothetical protein